ncbi:hypothetical protein ASC80_01570 [Afipia sp. Root123D2]|uniref:hypothetical protein n=1 Tax=Afipia sp. Root123D2 TaxID=1736436 RepID=UPI0006F64DDD|nr:hypothetical protein [Afipia sp. Root123D2]KQW22111.1 hypothetical protein ASC80_01570 [Afipia sp. Root123D2]
MSELLTLLHAGQAKEFYVEIANDDDSHHIIVGEFTHFDAAAEEYDRLTIGRPQMRVVMRHCAHIYRCYVPDRLRRPGVNL